MLVRRIARPLLSAVFIGQGIDALRQPDQAAETARPTAEGLQKLPPSASSKIPQDPATLARITAGVQIGGGLLLATGKLPRFASAALALTVVPGSLGGHLFWTESDPERKAQARRDFLTDLSLIGGLIIASVDTEGKPSIGWRGRRAAMRAQEAVIDALPGGSSNSAALLETVGERVSHGLQTGAERGREFADVAAERVSPLLDVARERGAEFADVASKRGAEFADVAGKRGAEFAEIARDRGAEWANRARERSAELADVAADRGSDWADTARKQGKKTAKQAQKRGKKATKQTQKRAEKAAKQYRKQAEKQLNAQFG